MHFIIIRKIIRDGQIILNISVDDMVLRAYVFECNGILVYYLTNLETYDGGVYYLKPIGRGNPRHREICNGMPGLALMNPYVEGLLINIPSAVNREVFVISRQSVLDRGLFVYREGMADIFYVRTENLPPYYFPFLIT